MSSANTGPGFFDRLFGRDQAMEVRELLQVAMNFFMEGRRQPAIPYLKQVLEHRHRDPHLRLAAAGLMGETLRGMGEFLHAQNYYQLSIDESEKVDNKQQSEWYDHYRPRSQLGLITVLRRTLSDEHRRITDLIADARDHSIEFTSRDLPAQFDAVEGLYLRQLGDAESSVRRLRQAITGMKGLKPPYAFLWPEHIEALLALSYLCCEGSAMEADEKAREIFEAKVGPWSTAVASLTLLHLHFRLKASDLADGFSMPEDEDSKTEIERLFQKLQANAAWEMDPLLISEEHHLRLVLDAANGNRSGSAGRFAALGASIKDAPLPLVLLRAVEAGSLVGDLVAPGQALPSEALEILGRGSATLGLLRARLESYRLEPELIEECRILLDGEARGTTPLALWNSNAVKQLRCRLWP